MAIVNESEAFFVVGDGFLHVADFSIQLAQGEVVAGQVRSDEQPDILEISRRRLVLSVGSFNVAANAAKEIDLVAQLKRDLIDILRDRGAARDGANCSTIRRESFTKCACSSR